MNVDLPTSIGAVRRLSVDVANLTTQLAFIQSSVEIIQQTAQSLTPDAWSKEMVTDDGQDPQTQITITGDQADNLMQLLASIQALG